MASLSLQAHLKGPTSVPLASGLLLPASQRTSHCPGKNNLRGLTWKQADPSSPTWFAKKERVQGSGSHVCGWLAGTEIQMTRAPRPSFISKKCKCRARVFLPCKGSGQCRHLGMFWGAGEGGEFKDSSGDELKMVLVMVVRLGRAWWQF